MDNKTFIDELTVRCGLEKAEVIKLTENFVTILGEQITEDNSVAIPSFGTFEPKKKMERVVVHPSSGKKLLVPPKLSVVFKPSTLLKQKIKGSSTRE